MNEEELRRELDEIKNENIALKHRYMEKETYIVGCGGEYCWSEVKHEI